MLVHGEEGKMQFLKGKIRTEFGIDCFMPANGETVTIQTECKIPVSLSLSMLKRAFTDQGAYLYCLRSYLYILNNIRNRSVELLYLVLSLFGLYLRQAHKVDWTIL